MNVTGLGWLGIRSEAHQELAGLFTEVLGVRAHRPEQGMTVFDLADGATVEVFSPAYPGKDHFDTGLVAGFWVDDLPSAIDELLRHGIPLLGGRGTSWQHFRAPGGLVLELKGRP